MAFTVETGEGMDDANAYVTVASADTYHSDRSNSAWSGASLLNKQSAIVKATDYIDAAFQFVGFRWSDTQSLEWPRDFLDSDLNNDASIDGVPSRVEKATYELALIALSEDLFKNPSPGDPVGAIKSKKDKVGEIEQSREFVPSIGVWRYPMIHRILRPLLVGQSHLLRV